MRMLLSDFVLFSGLAAFVAGLVIAAATLLIPHCSFLNRSLAGALRAEPSSLPPPALGESCHRDLSGRSLAVLFGPGRGVPGRKATAHIDGHGSRGGRNAVVKSTQYAWNRI